MTDNVDNLIIEQLKAIRNDLREMRQVNTDEHGDIKTRMSHLDAELIGIKRADIETAAETARQQVSLDQLTQRIERIERRLELVG
jgi:hypothetical protein